MMKKETIPTQIGTPSLLIGSVSNVIKCTQPQVILPMGTTTKVLITNKLKVMDNKESVFDAGRINAQMDRLKAMEEIVKKNYEFIFASPSWENSVNRKMNLLYIFPSMQEYSAQQNSSLLEALKEMISFPMEDLEHWASGKEPITITYTPQQLSKVLNIIKQAENNE
jgi:hypothetical protein